MTLPRHLSLLRVAIGCLTLSSVLAGALPAASLREVLAEFETGAMTAAACAGDHKIGRNKEVSRFQILPSVWHQYARSPDYRNPAAAWSVAERILSDRLEWFRRATGRDCDHVDLYLMWNAPGAYARARYDRRLMPRAVLERAERFANLAAARIAVATRLADRK